MSRTVRRPSRGRILRLFAYYIAPAPVTLTIALQTTIELRLAFALAVTLAYLMIAVYLDVCLAHLVRAALTARLQAAEGGAAD